MAASVKPTIKERQVLKLSFADTIGQSSAEKDIQIESDGEIVNFVSSRPLSLGIGVHSDAEKSSSSTNLPR